MGLKRDKYYNHTLRCCKCKGAQYCNNTCYQAHWKDHKPEHNRLVKLLPSTGETEEETSEDNKKTTDANISKTRRKNLMIDVRVDRRRSISALWV